MLNNVFNIVRKARQKPLFSFVILTWNRYKFLEKCIHSLLNSLIDADKHEIIVMDNGSNDKTSEVLSEYKGIDVLRVIHREKNDGLNAYKDLFENANGQYIVIVDDDVLSFPEKLDQIFITYLNIYKDYGFIALNVVQNEHTNGAKPSPEFYKDDIRGNYVIEEGPTGGWCACFRKKDYKKIKKYFLKDSLDMRNSEDGRIANLMSSKLGLKSGLIKNATCFHACGPYYAKEYGHLEREIEKYSSAGLRSLVSEYKRFS